MRDIEALEAYTQRRRKAIDVQRRLPTVWARESKQLQSSALEQLQWMANTAAALNGLSTEETLAQPAAKFTAAFDIAPMKAIRAGLDNKFALRPLPAIGISLTTKLCESINTPTILSNLPASD